MATRTPTAPVNDWVDVSANDWQDVPAGGAPTQQQKPAGNFLERALRPVDEALTEGSRMMYEGGKAAWNEPTWERKAKGVSQVFRGAGTALSPALAPAALANPIATAGRLGAGLIAQKAVEGTGKAVGVPEGYSELAGDVAGGVAAAKGPTNLPKFAGGTPPARGPIRPVVEAAADMVPYFGGKAVKLGNAIENWRNPPPQPRPTAAPPAQTGSNNRTPLPAPPVTAPPPAIQGSNAPPLPPQAKPITAAAPPLQGSNAPPLPPARAQVGAPPLTGSNAPPQPQPRPQMPSPPVQGSNAPPAMPRPQASAPPLQGSNNRTSLQVPTVEAGPPIPPEPTPQAGPPTPPAMEPQAGPPQPPKPQGGAVTPPPNTITSGAGRTAYDNAPGKFRTTEEVAQFAKANGVSYEEAVKGFTQAGSKVLDRGGMFREIHDPRINTMGHPEISAAFRKMFPGVSSMKDATPAQLARFHREVVLPNAMGEFAKGGVIVPAGKERVRGMAHRWGPKGRRGQ